MITIKKPAILVAAFLVALLALSPALKVAFSEELDPAVLWFYSVDPPPSLPDPQTWDPNYVGFNPDPWIAESIVVSGKWSEPFSMWLACHQFESLETKLVVSVNLDAKAAIDYVNVTTPAVDATITSWSLGGPPGPLAPHGVFNSAEFGGYAEVMVGDLYSPPATPFKAKIDITIKLKEGATITPEMKIHFDAYGHTADDKPTTSPYSHDFTFVVPEPATIAMVAASFAGFALFAVKHRKK